MVEFKGKKKTIVFGHGDILIATKFNENKHLDVRLCHYSAGLGKTGHAVPDEVMPESLPPLANVRFENLQSLSMVIDELILRRKEWGERLS